MDTDLKTQQKGKLLAAIICAFMLGAGAAYFFLSNSQHLMPSKPVNAEQPLYWVAPMDSNYRRDKPGKSPMGMDLIPVYKNQNTQQNDDKGIVTIAPHIIQNLGIKTHKIRNQILEKNIDTVGYVYYDEDKLVHIHPRVEGWVEQLFVKSAGDPVVKGQALYTLYSAELVNAQQEYLIALKNKNMSVINASKARLRSLHINDEFIQQLTQTKKVQQTITFYAPQKGVIASLQIREGFYVEPGTTMMSIAQLEQVWVEAEVFESDTASIQVGQKVTMTLDYLPTKQWQGQVDYIYPTLNQANRTLRVRLRFENHHFQLKPNMFAQVKIHIDSEVTTLLVPKHAVIRTGKRNTIVLALGDGKFKSVNVQIGKQNDRYFEVLAGLREGDNAVTSAHFLLDSESAKTSDFKRISSPKAPKMNMPISKTQATVKGVINAINKKERRINITREGIPKWQRGPATMDFILAKNIDISSLKTHMQVRFTFDTAQNFNITELEVLEQSHHKHHSH